MASLARSLFALAVLALLQAACALHPEYYPPGHRSASDDLDRRAEACKTYYFGRHGEIMYDLPPIQVSERSSRVELRDNRNFRGTVLVGVKVAACDVHNKAVPRVSLSFGLHDLNFLEVEDAARNPRSTHIELRVTRFREESRPSSNDSN